MRATRFVIFLPASSTLRVSPSPTEITVAAEADKTATASAVTVDPISAVRRIRWTGSMAIFGAPVPPVAPGNPVGRRSTTMLHFLWYFDADGWPLERIDTETGQHLPVFTGGPEELLDPQDGERPMACCYPRVAVGGGGASDDQAPRSISRDTPGSRSYLRDGTIVSGLLATNWVFKNINAFGGRYCERRRGDGKMVSKSS
jgi:hypothetical protein